MPAYWLARAKINDPIAYKRYTDQVPKIIGAHGGKVLGRGGKFKILEGPEKFERFVVIEFPSLEAAENVGLLTNIKTLPSTGRMGLVKTN